MEWSWQPKRVRVAIVTVTLALCAFFLAQGVTNLLALKFIPLPAVSAGARSTKPLEPLKGALPPDMHAILKRNIFDPQTGPLWPPKQAEPSDEATAAEETETVPPLAEGEMPPPCEGNVRLVASIYRARREAWSIASLSLGTDSPLLYRIGSSVDSKTIDSIYPEAVFLKETNGALCSLSLFKPQENGKPKAPTPVIAPVARTSSQDSELDQGIQKVSDTKYSVQRSLVDKLLQNQAQLMRSARVVPHEENGRVVGVKLYGIRRNSLLGKLGLQNGDMLRTINGFDMGSPDSALEAYAKLRSASNLSVALVRRGNAVTMEYNIGN